VGCNKHAAAELARLGGSRVGVVDRECDMPMRLLVVGQRLEHRYDVLEPGRAHLGRSFAHPRNDRLEIIAIARQRPELRARE
jgi:hypothetical protein